MELIQLKAIDVSRIRNEILLKQNNRCALCNEQINECTGYSLDHQHKIAREVIGEDGAGLIRGVLCRSCNVLEGKIWNNTRRYIQPKNVQERIEFLESLISYYKQPTYQYIHPSENVKEPIVSKRNYNKLKKVYDKKAKFPEYPKSKKITIKLKELFKEYNIEPYN